MIGVRADHLVSETLERYSPTIRQLYIFLCCVGIHIGIFFSSKSKVDCIGETVSRGLTKCESIFMVTRRMPLVPDPLVFILALEKVWGSTRHFKMVAASFNLALRCLILWNLGT